MTPTLQSCLGELSHSHIIIDTNFLIDASISMVRVGEESPYREMIQELKSKNCVFVTFFPVELEFYKGSDLLRDRYRKEDFFRDTVDVLLPVDESLLSEARTMTMVYRSAGSRLSITDYVLAAGLMKYGKGSSNVLLLTKDHGDFPLSIFDRFSVIPLQHETAGVDLYALFTYSENKVMAIQKQLLKIEARAKT